MNLTDRIHAMHRFWRYRLKHDRHEISLVRKHVGAGQTVLDIGAHRGAYTYWLAHAVGAAGSVFAFEPQPALVSYLEEIKRSFRLSNVEIVEKALSSTNRDADLFQPDCHPLGGASLESFPDYEGSHISVSTQRLDDFADQDQDLVRPITFIKCDAQDHELDVFRGGERVLREDKPTLLFECMPYQWEALSCYLESIGYTGTHAVVNHKLYQLDNEQWRTDYQRVLGNFLFVHRTRMSQARAA